MALKTSQQDLNFERKRINPANSTSLPFVSLLNIVISNNTKNLPRN